MDNHPLRSNSQGAVEIDGPHRLYSTKLLCTLLPDHEKEHNALS
jgi:hypothetical protein